MTAVVATYVFTEEQFIMGKYFDYRIGIAHGIGVALAIFIFYVIRMILRKDHHLKAMRDETTEPEIEE